MPLPHATPLPLGPYLAPERVLYFDDPCDKHTALTRLAACIAEAPGILQPQAFHQAIMEREAIGSTGIGRGVAIPHCKLPSIQGFNIGVGIAAAGIEYGAPDNKPVRLLVMIGATDQERRDYLRLLATVAALLKDAAVLDDIIACREPAQVVERFHRT